MRPTPPTCLSFGFARLGKAIGIVLKCSVTQTWRGSARYCRCRCLWAPGSLFWFFRRQTTAKLWRWEWRSPQNGFVERILTQQHCAHRLRKQAWVVNPGKEGNILRPGWGKKDEKSKERGRGANDRDQTCSKNWDTKKKIYSSRLGISSPLESGQIERWYFDRRAR